MGNYNRLPIGTPFTCVCCGNNLVVTATEHPYVPTDCRHPVIRAMMGYQRNICSSCYNWDYDVLGRPNRQTNRAPLKMKDGRWLTKDRVLEAHEYKEKERVVSKKEAEYWREYWNRIDEWKSLPILRCQYCGFQNVYQESINQHMTYTHIRGHPSPPNIWLPFMCEKEILDWEDAMSGRNTRRSHDLGLECHCPTNPVNWPIPGKECTCHINEYKCEAHPRIQG